MGSASWAHGFHGPAHPAFTGNSLHFYGPALSEEPKEPGEVRVDTELDAEDEQARQAGGEPEDVSEGGAEEVRMVMFPDL